MELRQLRYFVTLAEELHFGRAAAREHIVQSALSQQVQRLEREVGVRLLDRSTHHVDLTPAGAAFLIEARQILDHVSRAVQTARNAAASVPTLRVGIIDAGYDTMPQILRELQHTHPGITIHQVEAGTPEQYRQLADGRLDIAIGHASQTPAEVTSKLIRLDPLGVLVPDDHRFADLDGVPVTALADELLLLGEESQTPELNQFVIALCRSAGFAPAIYEGTVESTRAAADLVLQHRCVHCVPSSFRTSNRPGTTWRPLIEPATHYPWSLLWHDVNPSPHIATVINSARQLAERLGWLEPAAPPTEPAPGEDVPTAAGHSDEAV
ncbi:DNA-binding transcriptional LysR family regulator [Nonomuraea fuscirosea]|uniref:DNA-binding transcriptional LysR family regulator n=1 Tax=Nonomuraea fuscirosea TaxID=1291556 RepID=A0A2T0MMG2_9ACTN|nr:LysR substrate-binding domain-containing protein [Nonomuraea fuscirosea]PRX59036.1 DNA-binding transcriptional LysR family regulator [Nonomuraea fuscirosea]